MGTMMGFEYIYEPFSYAFMIRSLIVAVSVGLMLPLLGSYVINRNLGFMGDAIAHASLPALVFGLLIGVNILIAAIPAAILLALLLGYLINKSNIGEDTAIGIIFSSFFALGFILLSIFKNIALNVEDLLFGQILGVSSFDVSITLILTTIVIITSFILYKQFLFISFDPKGAKVAGIKVNLFNNIFLVLLSLAIIAALQSVGIILVLSMLITPAAAAKLIIKSFPNTIITGAIFGITASMSGLYLSYYLDFPSGPSMALTATLIFIIVWILKRTISYAN
ncbi:MAG: hypothetical protein CL766_03230 [Chloroflexi bacterium]|jgi:manganese/iron transport system permease protein|nr:hypothetical protein [Chloroflexota bacterium]MCH2304464.1 metal ABC transporter permease [SAR202 cluster bacterium]